MEKTTKEFFDLKPDHTVNDIMLAFDISKDECDNVTDTSHKAVNLFPDNVTQQIEHIINNSTKKELLVMLISAHINLLTEDYGVEFDDADEPENPN